MMLKVVGGLMRVAGLVWGRRCGLRALKAPLLLHLAHICGILGQKWSFYRSRAGPEISTSMSKQLCGHWQASASASRGPQPPTAAGYLAPAG